MASKAIEWVKLGLFIWFLRELSRPNTNINSNDPRQVTEFGRISLTKEEMERIITEAFTEAFARTNVLSLLEPQIAKPSPDPQTVDQFLSPDTPPGLA